MRIIAIWLVVALAVNFDQPRIVINIGVRNDARAQHLSDLSSALALEVQWN